jgi:uncharacterized membrane protein
MDFILQLIIATATLAWFILTIIISGKMSEIKLLIAQVDRDLQIHRADYKARHEALETHLRFLDSRMTSLEHNCGQRHLMKHPQQ